MKTLIVYRSVLGASKQYATWLHEAVPSDMLSLGNANSQKLGQYDTVVLICGIYATRLSLGGYMQRNWETLKSKRVIFISVAGSPEDNVFSTKAFSRIPENIRASIRYFHLQGKVGLIGASEVKSQNLKPVLEYLASLYQN
jgi:menaquinone-dependent protoporphyrinogen IX oxidase